MRTPNQTPAHTEIPDMTGTYTNGYLAPSAEVSERLDLSFSERVECGLVTDVEMVQHLREVLPGKDGIEVNPDALKDTVAVMHHFIKKGILENQAAGGERFVAYDLLSRSQEHIRVKEALYGHGVPKHSGGDYNNGIMRVNPSILSKEFSPSPSLTNRGDRYLLSLCRIVAHEQGHAISDGVANYLAETYAPEPAKGEGFGRPRHNRYQLSESYLRQHTDEAMTGHGFSDIRNEEERLAEGFRDIGMPPFMRAAGFSEATITKYLKSIEHTPQTTGKLGENQIDTLKRITATEGPAQLVGEDAPGEQHNPGLLGYDLPRTSAEVIEALAGVEDTVKNAHVPITREEWLAVTQGKKSPKVAKHIAGLQSSRRRALARDAVLGREGSVRKKITVGLGAAAALALMAVEYENGALEGLTGPTTSSEQAVESAETVGDVTAVTIRTLTSQGYAVHTIDQPPPHAGTNHIFSTTKVDALGRPIVDFYTK